MSDHYYSRTPNSAHDVKRIEADIFCMKLLFETDAGVFSKDGLDEGTRILLEALPELSGRVLDLCCGWGAVGIALKKRQTDLEVVMTDVNERAVELTKRNLALNGCTAEVFSGDGFEKIEGSFDAIVTNPPIRAGKAVIYEMFRQAGTRLRPEGALYIVIRKQQGAPSCVKYLKERFEEVEIIERKKGYWVIISRTAKSGC